MAEVARVCQNRWSGYYDQVEDVCQYMSVDQSR